MVPSAAVGTLKYRPRNARASSMGKHEVELFQEIEAAPAKIWTVLTDPSKYPQWMKHLHRVDWNGKSLKVGSRLKLVSVTASKNEISVEVEVTHFDVPKHLAWRSVEELWNGEPQRHVSDLGTEFVLEAHETSKVTDVRVNASFVAQSLKAKLGASLLLNTKIRPELEKALAELKKRCE